MGYIKVPSLGCGLDRSLLMQLGAGAAAILGMNGVTYYTVTLRNKRQNRGIRCRVAVALGVQFIRSQQTQNVEEDWMQLCPGIGSSLRLVYRRYGDVCGREQREE
ncbi:hypothetical protein BDN72DRAFT_839312 [Pluteus cervinus]|uniref:Uncharacterized protein n=1 Tax=Pluteus cervinus TaxID=181527 RepID=A0ACD3AWU1_9AGAR|nr:hypothetical protein BDN72DRAFT_839312 [Pluteus cervinus]